MGNTFDIGNFINVWDQYFGKGAKMRDEQLKQQQLQTRQSQNIADESEFNLSQNRVNAPLRTRALEAGVGVGESQRKRIEQANDAIIALGAANPDIHTATFLEGLERAKQAKIQSEGMQYDSGQKEITNQNFSNEFPGQTPDSQRLITQEKSAQQKYESDALEALTRREGVIQLRDKGLSTSPITAGIQYGNENVENERFRNLMASETMDRQNEQFKTRQAGEALQTRAALPIMDAQTKQMFDAYLRQLGVYVPIVSDPKAAAATRQKEREAALFSRPTSSASSGAIYARPSTVTSSVLPVPNEANVTNNKVNASSMLKYGYTPTNEELKRAQAIILELQRKAQ